MGGVAGDRLSLLDDRREISIDNRFPMTESGRPRGDDCCSPLLSTVFFRPFLVGRGAALKEYPVLLLVLLLLLLLLLLPVALDDSGDDDDKDPFDNVNVGGWVLFFPEPRVRTDDCGGGGGIQGEGEVMGRLQNNSLTRSSSVFQCGWQSVYSNGMNMSFLSIIFPRLTQLSK